MIPDYAIMDIVERWTMVDKHIDTIKEVEVCDYCGKEFIKLGKRSGQYSFCCAEHSTLFHTAESRRDKRGKEQRFRSDKYRIVYDATTLDEFDNECRYPVGAVIPGIELDFMLKNNLFTPGTQILNTHTGEIITVEANL